MNYIKKYEIIIRNLIKKDFPVLKGKKIIIQERKAKWRAHVAYFPNGLHIWMNYKIRNFSKKLIKRILIHELCHLEIFSKWGIILTNLDYLIYSLSKNHRKKVEAEANILMIKKGYGKLVLEARKDNLIRGLNFSLSEKEIKNYMKLDSNF